MADAKVVVVVTLPGGVRGWLASRLTRRPTSRTVRLVCLNTVVKKADAPKGHGVYVLMNTLVFCCPFVVRGVAVTDRAHPSSTKAQRSRNVMNTTRIFKCNIILIFILLKYENTCNTAKVYLIFNTSNTYI
jgi:hypothetical protein